MNCLQDVRERMSAIVSVDMHVYSVALLLLRGHSFLCFTCVGARGQGEELCNKSDVCPWSAYVCVCMCVFVCVDHQRGGCRQGPVHLETDCSRLE